MSDEDTIVVKSEGDIVRATDTLRQAAEEYFPEDMVPREALVITLLAAAGGTPVSLKQLREIIDRGKR